jgi:hypothetical protein
MERMAKRRGRLRTRDGAIARSYARRGRRRVGACLVAALGVVAAAPAPAPAVLINEVLASWQGDDEVQFVELYLETATEQVKDNRLKIQYADGSELVINITTSATTGQGRRFLLGTPKVGEAAILKVAPDETITAGVLPVGAGRICYQVGDTEEDCVAYGSFGGRNPGFACPSPLTPVNRSLERKTGAGSAPVDTRNNQRDFAGDLQPSPENNKGTRFSPATPCGNLALDPGEQCDPTRDPSEARCASELGGETCVTQGFGGGTLCCRQCRFDTSGCTTCGNGQVEARNPCAGRTTGEECDGDDQDGATCANLGYTTGDLACTDECRRDTSGCSGLQIPGSGRAAARTDCALEWHVVGAPTSKQRPPKRQRCRDGDSQCDGDDTAGSCTFRAQLCFNRDDRRLLACSPLNVRTFELASPAADSADPVARDNAARILAAVAALEGTVDAARVTFDPPLSTVDVCTAAAEIVVPLREREGRPTRAGKAVVAARVIDEVRQLPDSDRITLRCLPAGR